MGNSNTSLKRNFLSFSHCVDKRTRSTFRVENLHIDIAELLAFLEEARFKCLVTFDKMVRHYEQLSLKQLLKQLQKQRSFKAVFTFIGTYKYQTVKIVLHTEFELGCVQFSLKLVINTQLF